MVAISVVQTGNAAFSKTAGTTLSLSGMSSVTAGDIVVVTTGFDNTTATAPTVTAAHTGAAAITWTTRITSNSVSATAGAAVRSAIITGVVTSGGTLTDITLTYSASITAKSADWRVFRYASTTSFAGAVGASGTSGTWSVTSSAEAVAGDLVVGVVAVEGTAVPTDDTDTTGGSWVGTLTSGTTGGSGATNMQHKSQYKIATGPVTAVFNGTVTSTDWSASTLVIRVGSINSPASFSASAVRGGVLTAWNVPVGGLTPIKYIVYKDGVEAGQVVGIVNSLTNFYFVPCITSYAGDGTIDTTSHTYTVKAVAGDGSLSVDSNSSAASALSGKLIKITAESSTSNIGTKLYVNGDDWTVLSDGSNSTYLDVDATAVNGYVRYTLPDFELDANSVIYGLVARVGLQGDNFTATLQLRDSSLTSIGSYSTYLYGDNGPPSLLKRDSVPTAGTYSGAFLDVMPLAVTSADTRFYEAILIVPAIALTQVNKDLSLVWNDRATVGQADQLIWNVRSVVNKSLQAIWNSKDTTLVGKVLQLIWNDRATVGQQEQLIWNQRATVGNTDQWIWNVRSTVTKSVQAIWNMRAVVGQADQLIWNTRTAVGNALQAIWNVLQLVATTPVNRDLQLIWNQRQTVNAQDQLVWNVRALVNAADQYIWNVRATVGQQDQLIWNVRSIVGATDQLIWNVRSLVNSSRQLIWNAYTTVSNTRQVIWNIRAAAGNSLQAVWHVLQNVATTPINRDLQLVWNVRAVVGQADQMIWNTRATVGNTRQAIWNVNTTVGQVRQLIWNDRATTGKTLQSIWNSLSLTTKTLQFIWNNRTLVNKGVQVIWNDRNTTAKELVLIWKVGGYFWIEYNPGTGLWVEVTRNASGFVEVTRVSATYAETVINNSTWVEVNRPPVTWNEVP
jgi:hypothetical protein